MSKLRNRQFCLVLYEEDETHRSAIEKIKRCYMYAMIRHDMDTYEENIYEDDGVTIIHAEGEVKKPHYHIVLKFDNARYISSLANDLGIAENYIQPCSKIKKALLYLIHYNDYDKYLYPIESVQGPLKMDLIRYINQDEKDENLRVAKLYKWIDYQPKPLSVCKLSKYCYENGLWDVFRRSSSIFFKILDEYNYSSIKGVQPTHLYYHETNIDEVLEQLDMFS